MSSLLTIDSSELTNFINAVKEGIKKTQKNGTFELITPIDFELSVTIRKEGKGRVNLAVIGAGGKLEKESISKINFSIGNPMSWESLEKMAKVHAINSKVSNETIEAVLKMIESQKKL